MNKYHFYTIIFAILIIPFGAYIDAIVIENTNFKGYLIICAIEASIFLSGMYWGALIQEKELKKSLEVKK